LTTRTLVQRLPALSLALTVLFGCAAEGEAPKEDEALIAGSTEALTTGPLHVLKIGGNQNNPSSIYHTMRNSDGTWASWGNVGLVAVGAPTHAEQVASAAGSDGELHVVVVDSGITPNRLFYTIRGATGFWAPFTDLASVMSTPASSFGWSDVTITDVAGEKHIMATNSEGKLYHTIRAANGAWSGWGDVGLQAGNKAFSWVANANVSGEMHACVLSGGVVWHSIRRVNGSWTPFGGVNIPGNIPPAGQLTDLDSIDCVGVGTSLQLAVRRLTGNWPNVTAKAWLTARSANGAWSTGVDVGAATGSSASINGINLAAGSSGSLHVLGLVGTASGDTTFHALRSIGGTWSTFNSMSFLPGGSAEYISDVSAE